jgi:ABC-2 type transport system ATP-binding protein
MIQVRNLTKTYISLQRGHTFRAIVRSLFKPTRVEVQAVKNVSFEVAPGELIGYLGPNGAGKSTTLKILTGVLFPTSGEVSILGYTPWQQRKRYVANIGAVFGQKSQLIWDIPPIDSFYMNKAIYSIPASDFEARLKMTVAMLGVEDVIQKPSRNLSLGERMKCEFIMAMLHSPRIVFLDEPTIGLDVIAKDTIRQFIQEQNQQGVTFILTTHDLDDVEHLAKRVIVINHGEVVFNDSMKELKSHLGQKKIVHLATHEILPALTQPGINILQTISRYEVELELDVAQLPLNQFIQDLNASSSIRDLAIQELPIERVIKELYH